VLGRTRELAGFRGGGNLRLANAAEMAGIGWPKYNHCGWRAAGRIESTLKENNGQWQGTACAGTRSSLAWYLCGRGVASGKKALAMVKGIFLAAA